MPNVQYEDPTAQHGVRDVSLEHPLPTSAGLSVGGAPVGSGNPVPTQDFNGHSGTVTTTNTTPVTGNFHAITAISDAEFSAFTEAGGIGNMTGFVVPAGITLFGRITGYTLASGRVRAYTI